MPSGDVYRALSLPPAEIGPRLLAIAEDQWFERKSARVDGRKLSEAEVGFANADGGVVVVGLTDDGKVEGTRANLRHRNDLIQAAVQLTEPPVSVKHHLRPCINFVGEPDDLLVLEVAPSRVVHATTRDEVYLRVGESTRRMNFNQRRELLYDKSQAGFETEPTNVPLEDVDQALLENYAQRIGAPDTSRLLRARGLSDERTLTIAGCLLFASNPGGVLPNAHIRVSRFAGRERGLGARQQLIEDHRIEGPVPRALMEAQSTIERLQPRRRALSRGAFEDIALVPEDAWLEAVVNAAVHRSYSLGGDHIHVDVFDDRIEVESPGRFPGLVDMSDPLNTTRFARNPRIARVCADLRLGQELGEGIRRMFEEMRFAGLSDPLYHQTSGSVQLVLSGEPVDRKLDAQLPDQTRIIVSALREMRQLSTGEVAELLGVARPTAIRRLQRLQTAGLVEWSGKSPSDPRAFWRLTGH